MKAVRTVLLFAGMLLVGLAVGYLLGSVGLGQRLGVLLEGIPLWVLLVQLLLANLLVLTLHELGHLLMGLALGNQFALFVVGPLKMWAENGRTRIGLNKDFRLFGGVAATVPRNETRLVQRMAWVAAAGPLTSLLVTAVAGLGLLLPLPPAWLAFLGVLSLSGLFNVLAVTIPDSTSGFLTDRARWQMLRRGGPAAVRWTAVAQLTARALQSQRPRTWDPEVVAQAVALPDGSIDDLNGRLYALLYYLDTNQIEAAGAQLDALLADVDALPALMRPAIFVEAAYFFARFRRDAAAARAWLKRAPDNQFVEKLARLRAETAVLLAEGKEAQAQQVLETAVSLANSAAPTSSLLAEKAWLHELETQLQLPHW